MASDGVILFDKAMIDYCASGFGKIGDPIKSLPNCAQVRLIEEGLSSGGKLNYDLPINAILRSDRDLRVFYMICVHTGRKLSQQNKNALIRLGYMDQDGRMVRDLMGNPIEINLVESLNNKVSKLEREKAELLEQLEAALNKLKVISKVLEG